MRGQLLANQAQKRLVLRMAQVVQPHWNVNL